MFAYLECFGVEMAAAVWIPTFKLSGPRQRGTPNNLLALFSGGRHE
jgi:hypothetical protein